LKKTTDAAAADMQKSLQREHDRASRLEMDLAASRRKVETQTALAAKAGAEASQLKKTTDAAAADMQKSLQREHDRASRLEQHLAASRRDVETQTALATRANAEAGRLKQVADGDSAELKRSLQEEHDRAEALAKDLSMVHTAIYAYEAQARVTSDQAAGFK
jgi:septal ring factor EnvC (AmiA/AmiB activator)